MTRLRSTGRGLCAGFLDVTLPQLKEVLIVVVVSRTIWTFNKFEEIYLLTKGGPGTSTFNLAVYSLSSRSPICVSASGRPLAW